MGQESAEVYALDVCVGSPLSVAEPEGEWVGAWLLRLGVHIHAARGGEATQAARALQCRKYEQRGYHWATSALETHLMTLTAQREAEVLGTLSVRFDGPSGLAADACFADEMRQLRASGDSLCEFTRLALDIDHTAQRVLACLFHVAYLYAYRLREAQRLVVEVNPRHVGFYRRMLGFEVCGEARLNPQVAAPAVLMSLNFSHAQQQIARYGGQPGLGPVARSLYPYGYSPFEEEGLLKSIFFSS